MGRDDTGKMSGTAGAGEEKAVSETTDGVVLETTMGTMTFELFPEKAPATVANFKRLVEEAAGRG